MKTDNQAMYPDVLLPADKGEVGVFATFKEAVSQ